MEKIRLETGINSSGWARALRWWGRLAWGVLAAIHAYLGVLHLIALPGEWAFNDIWKGFGAAGGALVMLWWALRPGPPARPA